MFSLSTQRCYGLQIFSRNSFTSSGLSILKHGVISLPGANVLIQLVQCMGFALLRIVGQNFLKAMYFYP